MPKAKRKSRKGFKRSNKEWEESLSGHIGRLVDRLSFDDWLALAIGAVAGYATESWEGALTGMIGYKLATTRGGSPPVAQIAGLVTLSGLGLASLAMQYDYLPDIPTPGAKDVTVNSQTIQQAGIGPMVKPTGTKGNYVCPLGYTLVYLPHGAIMCQLKQ